jgi:hypothetical protein
MMPGAGDEKAPRPDSPVPAAQEPADSPKPPEGGAGVAVHGSLIGTQVVTAQATAQTYNFFNSTGPPPPETPLQDLVDDLRSLPPHLHSFREPRHANLVRDLEDQRIVLLSSYQESAAFAAAYSLVTDDHFSRQQRKVLSPGRKLDKERLDLDLLALAGDAFLERGPQILLIDIVASCTLLDSALALASVDVGRICRRLVAHESYMILAVDDELLANQAATARVKNLLPFYSVSHLRYLLACALGDRAEELEERLWQANARWKNPMAPGEIYQHVTNRLAKGVAALEDFLRSLEEEVSLPPAVQRERLQSVRPQNVFVDDSEVHRAAAFIATYLPGMGQQDFEKVLLLLLGDSAARVERTRQVAGANGETRTVREEVEERWSDRWFQGADRIFDDCHLRTAEAADGSWAVDFSEPYLRRELRVYLERHFPWYVRQRCKTLQESGVLFDPDLAPPAIEGLVRLFVERGAANPAGFGGNWLLDMVGGLRARLHGSPPADSPAEVLAWLLERVAIETHRRALFQGRLALLIREMLDSDALRPAVHDFFEFLLAARQHDALLEVILGLSRRLRFAPHFDPLLWMRRLLDEGSDAVRGRTADALVSMAVASGLRIYEFLEVVRHWLPAPGRPQERFSAANRLALDLPFLYCLRVARSLPPERFGAWPSRHPLFNALPGDPAAAREEIARLVAWVFDARGAALEEPDTAATMRTAEVVRIGRAAELVEHWAWVLEGGADDGPLEGRALFALLVQEIQRQLGDRERAWLQRGWQRRQDEYLQQAASTDAADRAGRAVLVARRSKLDRLRSRFAASSPGGAEWAAAPARAGKGVTP